MQERLTLDKIPIKYLDWLVSERLKFLNDLLQGKPMRYFSAHLPVMATWRNPPSMSPLSKGGMEGGGFSDENDLFPVNMTVKGLGLIPKNESLEHYIDVFEGVIAEARTIPWKDSLHKRVEAMMRLYGDVENLDPDIIGGLEIFEGRAFQNLRDNPYTSLLYMGMKHTQGGMGYISFQVNGKVEILDKENPYYKFLLASRKLFEFDKFHLYQPDYPFGYLVRVIEVKDKSPWSRIKEDPS